MRIRTIKPEFWASEDIAALDWPTRLLFIGLWSYVDDNGVGRDLPKLVVADLFPLEEDPRDTLATVSRGLQTLSERRLITRYTVAGRPFLHITTWDRHQRIDRPAKPRYPLPTCDDAVSRDTLATPSRDLRDSLDAVPGEQGNRGTGEQGKPNASRSGRRASPTEPDPAPAVVTVAPATDLVLVRSDDPPITAQTLVATWIDHCRARPPSNVIGQIAKHCAALLAEGIDPDAIEAGLAAWHAKGLHPSTLPSVVNEVLNPPRPQPNRRRVSPGDQALALIADMRERGIQ